MVRNAESVCKVFNAGVDSGTGLNRNVMCGQWHRIEQECNA
jgi:hypothetical protein